MSFMRFDNAIHFAGEQLKARGVKVDAGRWQGYPTEGKPDLVTMEMLNMSFTTRMQRYDRRGEPAMLDDNIVQLANEIKPNQFWANLEFNDRIAGVPTNPHASLEHWPWWKGQDASAMTPEGKFTHTYSERFWPPKVMGVRYVFGNLHDVVTLMLREPLTRQATFPIFFPEDTGVVHQNRVPCTLHYHFMVRDNALHLWYPIRSCDYVRHFRDDLYLACRLAIWVLGELRYRSDEEIDDPVFDWQAVQLGFLFFTAYSFHYHLGDQAYVDSTD